MADHVFRGFLHATYLKADKEWEKTQQLLEQLMLGNYETIKSGSRTMISSSVNGKSFVYQIPPEMGVHQINGMAQRCWSFIERNEPERLDKFLAGLLPSCTYADFSAAQPS